MKKFLLTMFAFLIATLAVDAQKIKTVGTFNGMNNLPNKTVLKKIGRSAVKSLKSNIVPAKISLEEDERILGYYTSDESPVTNHPFMHSGGTYTACSFYSANIFNKAEGGSITKLRIYLMDGIGSSSTISVYEMGPEGELSETPVTTAEFNPVYGWNDVMLENPVTVKEGYGYFIAYTFTIPGQQGTYVFAGDKGLNTEYIPGGIFVIGDFGQGYEALIVSTDSNLCIQMVVKGGAFSDDDIVLTGVQDRTIAKRGAKYPIILNLKNEGYDLPTKYQLDVQLDGTYYESLTTPVALTDNKTKQYVYEIELPEVLDKEYEHTVAISVASINEKTPTENTEDDKTSVSFKVYDESDVVDKQMTLVENFTAAGCPDCPLGDEFLYCLSKLRDDLALVSIHDIVNEVEDIYTTSFGTNIASLETLVYPSASFNRAFVSDASLNTYGSLALPIYFPQEQEVDAKASEFSNMIDQINSDIPAFASVNIDTKYDEATRVLHITVSGEGKQDVRKILPDGSLTVFLTEDGLKGAQYSNAGGSEHFESEYSHENVLRHVFDEWGFGEPIIWTGNTTYSNEFIFTVPEEWNINNMNVVASIGRPVKYEDMDGGYNLNSMVNDVWISNTNKVKIINTPSGIDNAVVSDDENVTEVARYALDGTRLSAPTKGINIVKMSDGTTKKVVVE